MFLLKLNLHFPKKLVFLYKKTMIKMIKNAFYFLSFLFIILKTLIVLKILRENGLVRKLRLISKLVTSQSGKQSVPQKKKKKFHRKSCRK